LGKIERKLSKIKNHSINSKAHENNQKKTKERTKHFIINEKKLLITL
jgi:hypothetical protein